MQESFVAQNRYMVIRNVQFSDLILHSFLNCTNTIQYSSLLKYKGSVYK